MLHVDLLLQHREPARVELGEVEHVVDEARQALGLLRDDLERDGARLLVLHDMTADRSQRRSQLVGHGHEEVPLQLLGLAQPARHLAEAIRQQRHLVAAAHARHRHVVVAARDLVGGARELQHRPRQPARDEHAEDDRDGEAAEQCERDPFEQRNDPRRELVLRLRDDERAVEDQLPVLTELERLGDAQPRLVRPRQLEVELQRPPLGHRREVDQALRQQTQARPLRSREEVDSRVDRDVEDAVACRVLELVPRHLVVRARRLRRIESRHSGCLPSQVCSRATDRVRLQQLERDRGGDEREDDGASEEESR